MPSFPLFTSIKPPANAGEFTYLRGCLDSWRAAGFNAVAVNGPSEIKALRPLDLSIEFAPLPIDGKPRIGAILSAIRECGVRFAGVINSDCRIVGYPGLIANLQASLDRTVVLAWRIDLGADGKPTTQRGGFDAFFFDTSVLPQDDCGFSIAEPWWDHWFPLACEMTGARLETLVLPLLTHKAHPGNCSDQTFIRAVDRFWRMLQAWHRRGDMPDSLLAILPPIDRAISQDDFGRLCAATPSWLYEQRPQTFPLLGQKVAEIEAMLRFGGSAIIKNSREEGCAVELALIRSSISWRITAPLRRAAIAARALVARHRPRGAL